ncbi:MAG: peptidylprolyl isomerase [Myxococcota bacterium]
MLTWAILVLACAQTPDPASPGPEPTIDPAGDPPPPAPDWPAPTEPRYAGSHILVAWKGAVDAPPTVTRTESEAKALAERLQREATPESFARLARESSDGPSAARGGRLGTWLTGTMVPDFERAVASVQPGQIGPIVRTPFGWHVVMREPVEQVRVAHILVGFSGALQSTSTRSRDEARALAASLKARLDAGEAFGAVAKEASEDSSAPRGGDLGVISRGQMVPDFEDAAFGLQPGEVSGVVETPYGFHIVERSAAE